MYLLIVVSYLISLISRSNFMFTSVQRIFSYSKGYVDTWYVWGPADSHVFSIRSCLRFQHLFTYFAALRKTWSLCICLCLIDNSFMMQEQPLFCWLLSEWAAERCSFLYASIMYLFIQVNLSATESVLPVLMLCSCQKSKSDTIFYSTLCPLTYNAINWLLPD